MDPNLNLVIAATKKYSLRLDLLSYSDKTMDNIPPTAKALLHIKTAAYQTSVWIISQYSYPEPESGGGLGMNKSRNRFLYESLKQSLAYSQELIKCSCIVYTYVSSS